MQFGIWTWVGPKDVICIRWQSRYWDTHWKGHFWGGGWHWDFPAGCRAPFPLAMSPGFPHMLSTSVPAGRPRKQLSVTLNFPDEKPAVWCGLSSKFFDHVITFVSYCSKTCTESYVPILNIFWKKTYVSKQYCSFFDTGDFVIEMLQCTSFIHSSINNG